MLNAQVGHWGWASREPGCARELGLKCYRGSDAMPGTCRENRKEKRKRWLGGNDFLAITAKYRQQKKQQTGLHKNNNKKKPSVHQRAQSTERQQPVNEKASENGPSDKRSMSGIYKECPQLSHKQIQLRKQAKGLSGHFSKEDLYKGPIIST